MKAKLIIMFILVTMFVFSSADVKVLSSSRKKRDSKNVSVYKQSDTQKQTKENNNVFVWDEPIHYLDHDVFIRNGKTLVIKPGTKVIATGNYGIFIKEGGLLKAIGKKGKEITFTADYNINQQFGEYLYTTKYETWKGIHFYSVPTGSFNHLNYCNFTNCITSAEMQSHDKVNSLLEVNNLSSVLLENCTFNYCSYLSDESSMVIADNARLTFRNSIFLNNEAAFRSTNSVIKFENCSFSDNFNINFNFDSGRTQFIDCNFMFCENLHFLSNSQNFFLLNRCHICESNSLKGFLSVKNCNDFRIAESNIQLSSENASISVYNSESTLKRSLFRSDQPDILVLDSSNQSNVLILNSEFESKKKGIIKLGSNINFYTFNSVFPATPQAVVFKENSSGSSITAMRNLYSKSGLTGKIPYRMKFDLSDNLHYTSKLEKEQKNPSDQLKYRMSEKDALLFSRGMRWFEDENVKFYNTKQDRNTVPDIGRKRIKLIPFIIKL